jgi:NitT/TauT family transport system substrate-binding protein
MTLFASFSRRAALGLVGALAMTAAGPALAGDKVSVGVLRFVSSGPFFLAVERGYFAKQSIDVEIKYFEAAQPIAVAVVSGDVDYGLTAFTGGFFNLAGKGALKVIAAQAKEAKGYEGNAILASNAAFDKGLKTPADLAGKTVGITQVGSSFHYQVGQIARIKGFDLKSVDMRPLQSLPNMIAALKSNQVDAALLAPHLAKPLVASGEAKLVGWYADLDEYQFGALFTSTKTAEGKRDLTQRFVRAYQQGLADYANAFLRKDAAGARQFDAATDKAATELVKYVYPSDAPEVGAKKVTASAFYVDAQGRLDVADIYKQIEWMKAQGLVDAAVDPKTALDLSFVEGHMNAPK